MNMSLPFRTFLRRASPAPTLLGTLSTRATIPQQPAAITRALHSISRHTSKRRLPQWPRAYSRHSPPTLQSPSEPALSLSARLRKLSREYGWSAFGVYLLLSALDFPFCFMAVRYIGADTIGHYEHIVVGHVSALIPEAVKRVWRETKESAKEALLTGNQTRISGGEGERGRVLPQPWRESKGKLKLMVV